jgi:hypothetical protein
VDHLVAGEVPAQEGSLAMTNHCLLFISLLTTKFEAYYHFTMNYISLLLIFLIQNQSLGSSLCKMPYQVSAYATMKSDLEKKIEAFANNKIVATQADALLSKLISAKSPVINSWINKRDLGNTSEKEIVKAWRIYFAQNFVLVKYPQDESKINTEIEKLVNQTLSNYLNSKFKGRMEKLFSTAKKMAIETIENYKIEKGPAMVERIQAIKLYWPKDLKSARNNAVPLDIIKWGVAYDPVPNEINIGLEALAYPNDSTYLAVFAHEIGHSFDSCRWGAFFDGKWPFEAIGECLRSDQSVGAKKRDDSKIEDLVKAGKLSKDLAMALKLNPTCNKSAYPTPGTQADQLQESFADWFSAEVVARIKDIDLTQLRADLCEKKELSEGSSYPSNEKRLERIYYLQPQLKEKIKTPDFLTGKYCGLK